MTVFAVLVGYPLSFGPACWLCGYEKLPRGIVAQVYRPILLLCHNDSPIPIRNFIFWYGDLVPSPFCNWWNGFPFAMDLCHEAGIPCMLFPPR